ncbi:MAG: glutathione S-transferase [Alphaproteobacteria bacterium]|nr:glutathione S-transferase [Alphaproteobacteria bacterium]NNF72686.1 glutathione S-transferase [Paracoccaceae bacterium]
MTYTLALGDRAYSSWSLRGWLMFEAFGIPVETDRTRMYTPAFAETLAAYPPARTVPALRLPDGTAIGETMAIAEELATRHPEAGLWPERADHRALARMLAAEMHAGFTALRGACPMNLRVTWQGFEPSAEVLADLERVQTLWAHAYAMSDGKGPWLFGRYSLADVFFAPVAARIAGYGLPVDAAAQAYVDLHLAHPAFRRWRAMGLVDGPDQPVYEQGLPRGAWPGPAQRPAKAVEAGPAENDRCPYSGLAVTHFLETGGRIFGFCNAFCRDKTVADPEAWPDFMQLLTPAR